MEYGETVKGGVQRNKSFGEQVHLSPTTQPVGEPPTLGDTAHSSIHSLPHTCPPFNPSINKY